MALSVTPTICLEFNENSGTSAANANTAYSSFSGTLNDGATWGTGKLGASSLSLDGSNDDCSLPASLGIDNVSKLTYAAWVNPTSPSVNYMVIISHRLDESNRIEMQLGGTGVGSTSGINCAWAVGASSANAYKDSLLAYGAWGHWMMVFDGTQTGDDRLKFYFNGEQQTLTFSAAVGTATPNTAASLTYIGTRNATLLPFKGLIDQVIITPHALTQADAKTLYNGGAGLRWPFTTSGLATSKLALTDLSLFA